MQNSTSKEAYLNCEKNEEDFEQMNEELKCLPHNVDTKKQNCVKTQEEINHDDKEAFLDYKIRKLKIMNEKMKQRYKEVEEDRKAAEAANAAVTKEGRLKKVIMNRDEVEKDHKVVEAADATVTKEGRLKKVIYKDDPVLKYAVSDREWDRDKFDSKGNVINLQEREGKGNTLKKQPSRPETQWPSPDKPIGRGRGRGRARPSIDQKYINSPITPSHPHSGIREKGKGPHCSTPYTVYVEDQNKLKNSENTPLWKMENPNSTSKVENWLTSRKNKWDEPGDMSTEYTMQCKSWML